MVDVKDAMSNLVHELGCLMLGGEFFDRDFTSDEGGEIGDRIRLQEAVDGRRKLAKSVLLPTRSVRYRLKFW